MTRTRNIVEILFRVLVVAMVIVSVVLFALQRNYQDSVNARHTFHATTVCAQLKDLTRAITLDQGLSPQVKEAANAYYVTDCTSLNG